MGAKDNDLTARLVEQAREKFGKGEDYEWLGMVLDRIVVPRLQAAEKVVEAIGAAKGEAVLVRDFAADVDNEDTHIVLPAPLWWKIVKAQG